MIQLTQLQETLAEMRGAVNQALTAQKLTIAEVVLSATESHMVKKLGDKKGILVAVKMPDADARMESADNYSEMNHILLFVLKKADLSGLTNQGEADMYNQLQSVTAKIKEWFVARGGDGNLCGADTEMQQKIRTEWEYNVFGGFYGLSISFDLRDFNF